MPNVVIDYLIEQANLNDGKNLQYEKDTLFLISRERQNLDCNVTRYITGDVNTLLQMQQLLTRIEKLYRIFVASFKAIMLDRYNNYYMTAYNQTGELIQAGKETYGRLTEGVSELGNQEYDETTIKFIRDHSFELIKGYSDQQLLKIRGVIGDMILRGTANKVNVRNAIQKILDTNRSKAEEIAQTELSRAYNYGTMARLDAYQRQNPDAKVRKYWHGFKYSEITCEYCRPRIGLIYDLNDESESLPAHVRCRCVWLPILDGWDKPISSDLIARANILNTAYSTDMIYSRINSRLNIDYGEYIDKESAVNYMAGDRSQKTISAISHARTRYIDDLKDRFDIAIDTSNTHMSKQFNSQLKFWEDFVGGAIADNDNDSVNKAYSAIKAVTMLPWNESQLSKWNSLLSMINLYR